jgi:hypothetical protein
MKTAIALLLLFGTFAMKAQTAINKSVVTKPGQKIDMHFDYPDLIKISTWDKEEISIQGTVSINGGESDDAFELISETDPGVVSVRSQIRNLKNLPQRITVVHNGKKMVFKNKAEYKKYKELNRVEFDMMNFGHDIEIQLEIKVPHNRETRIESVYGMVEVIRFEGPLKVTATYGGVDVALAEKNVGELVAETNYGQIYSNLATQLTGDHLIESDFHTLVAAKPGVGPRYSLDSKYGNVYLRKIDNNK